MRGDVMNVTRRLVTECCCNCGVEFAMPSELMRELRESHKSFYCPNGHGQSYVGKTDAEKLQEKLEAEQRNTEWWRKRQLAEERAREKAEHQRDAYKGHTTRLKKRVAKGKCPCCSCEFVNLKAHMVKRHPEFGASEGGVGIANEEKVEGKVEGKVTTDG